MTTTDPLTGIGVIVSILGSVVAILRTFSTDARTLRRELEDKLEKFSESVDKMFENFIPKGQMDAELRIIHNELQRLREDQIARHEENQKKHESTERKLDIITGMLLNQTIVRDTLKK